MAIELTDYEARIPVAVPNVYGGRRAEILQHWHRFQACQQELIEKEASDWLLPLRVQEQNYQEDLDKALTSQRRAPSDINQRRLEKAQQRLTAYAHNRRYAFYERLYHERLAQHRQRLERYRQALEQELVEQRD